MQRRGIATMTALIALAIGADPATQPATAPATQPSKYQSSIPKIMAGLREQIAELKEQVAALKNELGAQIAVNEKLKQEIAELRRQGSPNAGLSAQEVARAIKERRLLIGMTLADANKSMTIEGSRTSQNAKSSFYEWDMGRARWTATVVNGKLASWNYNGVKWFINIDGETVEYKP